MRIRSALVSLAALPLAGCAFPPGTEVQPPPIAPSVESPFEGAPPAATPPTTPTAAPTASPGPAAGHARLAELRTTERQPNDIPAYARAAFGRAWKDVDGNGCNQRDDVLLRDAVPGTTQVQQQRSCPHDVLAGSWIDPYTGRRVTYDDLKDQRQAQAIQIDHVVPLAEAWVSGAHAWSPERREHFANDLSVLVAADGPTNASKGSHDPAAWRPKQAYQCSYAVHWIDVKQRWDLAVDASEARALASMLDTCPTPPA